jgi:DNA helicase II / ATP-dependent DNA helicase PcrA
MTDVIEVSYTGDLLAHRRCGRAWAYEKHAGFHPYEVVQAMEGRLVHHAMEWLTRQYQEIHQRRRHSRPDELREQLEHYFRVLWARGIRTAFVSKKVTLDRVMENLYPGGVIDPIVKTVVEGAQHTEYELRNVRKVLPADFGGKSRILLTGVLDLVIQQQAALTYERAWEWDSMDDLTGRAVPTTLSASPGDVEIWDYKGTRAATGYIDDYVRQLLTYAALYRDRTGALPARCVLFFINEKKAAQRLLAIDVNDAIVRAALEWTEKQVRELQQTRLVFEQNPLGVTAGEFVRRTQPLGQRLTSESTQQCTACSFRFGCNEYEAYLGAGSGHPDIDILNVMKN